MTTATMAKWMRIGRFVITDGKSGRGGDGKRFLWREWIRLAWHDLWSGCLPGQPWPQRI